MKIRLVEWALLLAGGWTDRLTDMTKVKGAFRISCYKWDFVFWPDIFEL